MTTRRRSLLSPATALRRKAVIGLGHLGAPRNVEPVALGHVSAGEQSVQDICTRIDATGACSGPGAAS